MIPLTASTLTLERRKEVGLMNVKLCCFDKNAIDQINKM